MGMNPQVRAEVWFPWRALAGGPSTNQTGGPDCYPVLYLLSFKSLPKREKDLYFHFVCCTCGNKIATLIWDTCENSKKMTTLKALEKSCMLTAKMHSLCIVYS